MRTLILNAWLHATRHTMTTHHKLIIYYFYCYLLSSDVCILLLTVNWWSLFLSTRTRYADAAHFSLLRIWCECFPIDFLLFIYVVHACKFNSFLLQWDVCVDIFTLNCSYIQLPLTDEQIVDWMEQHSEADGVVENARTNLWFETIIVSRSPNSLPITTVEVSWRRKATFQASFCYEKCIGHRRQPREPTLHRIFESTYTLSS